MNKKLIALAVAGALVVPAAASAADVEVYGKARVSLGMVTNDNNAAGQSDSEISVTSHASRLGFKGSEDLGNGLTAIYQVEGEVDLDDSAKTNLTSRDSFVGLAGGWGTALLGRHDTPYKIATSSMDVFKDTHADYTGAGVNKTHDARLDNVVAYISPNMGGFSLAAAYSTDASVGGNNDDLDGGGNDPEDHQTAYSIAGMYTVGPVYASLAIQSVDNAGALFGQAATESTDALKFGITYKITDSIAVNGIYETTEVGNLDQDNVYLSGSFGITDATKLKVALGVRGEEAGVSDTEGTYFALGASTMMSKSTELYAQYAMVSNAKAGSSAQLYHVKAAAPAGDDPAAAVFAVGINVAFSSK